MIATSKMGCTGSSITPKGEIQYDMPMEMFLHSLQRVVPASLVSAVDVKGGVVRVCGRIKGAQGGRDIKPMRSLFSRKQCVYVDVKLIIETSFVAVVQQPNDEICDYASTGENTENCPRITEHAQHSTRLAEITSNGGCASSLDRDIRELSRSEVVDVPQTNYEYIPEFKTVSENLQFRSDFWLEHEGKRILINCKSKEPSLIVDIKQCREMYGDANLVGREKRENRYDDNWVANLNIVPGGLSRGGAILASSRTRSLISESKDPERFPRRLRKLIEKKHSRTARAYFSGASYGYSAAELYVGDVVNMVGVISEQWHPPSKETVLVLNPFSERHLLKQVSKGSTTASNFGKQGADHALIHLLKEEFRSPRLVVSTLDVNGNQWKLPNPRNGEYLNKEGYVVPSCEGSKVADGLPQIKTGKAGERDGSTKVIPCEIA